MTSLGPLTAMLLSAPGATALRGFWGYQGDQAPQGEGLFSPRRRHH